MRTWLYKLYPLISAVPPLAFVAGILSGFYLKPAGLFWPGLTLVFLLAGILLSGRRPFVAAVCLSSAGVLIGNFVCQAALLERLNSLPPVSEDGASYQVAGRLIDHWETPYGHALKLDRLQVLSPVGGKAPHGTLTVYTPDLEGEPPHHSEVRAWLRLKRSLEPRPFPWPIRQLRETYAPRFIGSVKSLKLLEISTRRGSQTGVLNEGNRELVALFLLGRASFLWRERFQPYGLGHLLAVSGLHCMIVFLLLQVILLPVEKPGLRIMLTIFGLLAFAHWMGWGVSVTRATLMLILWTILPWWNRPRSVLRLWFGLVVVSLATDPLLLLSAGFWYSFAASLGLVLGRSPSLRSPLEHPWLKRMRPYLPIISAQLFVVPINLMFDARSSMMSLFWNMMGFGALCVLLVLLGLCVLAYVIPVIGPVANGLETLMAKVLDLMAFDVEQAVLSRLPPTASMVFGLLVLLGLIMIALPREWRWYAALLLSGLFLLTHRAGVGEHLSVLDVGQGACMLYTNSQGDGYLFDAGGALPAGLEVEQLTRLMGAKRIVAAYLSHYNLDHYQFIEDLDPTIRIYIPEVQQRAFRGSPMFRDRQIIPLRKGDIHWLGDLRLSVLWPAVDETAPNSNESGLVMFLEGETWGMLLTGDAGHWVEDRFDYPPDKGLMILQVGHHGSKSATSPAFLARLKPDHAIISCGRRNRFGHPHPAVLETLERAGVKTWSTADHGSIQIGEGDVIKIRPLLGGE